MKITINITIPGEIPNGTTADEVRQLVQAVLAPTYPLIETITVKAEPA